MAILDRILDHTETIIIESKSQCMKDRMDRQVPSDAPPGLAAFALFTRTLTASTT